MVRGGSWRSTSFGRLAQRIADKRPLRLIRRYLESGVMVDGVVIERYEGSPKIVPFCRCLRVDMINHASSGNRCDVMLQVLQSGSCVRNRQSRPS